MTFAQGILLLIMVSFLVISRKVRIRVLGGLESCHLPVTRQLSKLIDSCAKVIVDVFAEDLSDILDAAGT